MPKVTMPASLDSRAARSGRPAAPVLLLGCALSAAALSAPGALSAQQRVPLYRDSTRPLAARVEDLLRRMTLEEKVAQMECMSPRDMDSVFAGGALDRYGPADARWGI